MRLLEHLHIVEILREAEDERHSVLSDLGLNDTTDECLDGPPLHPSFIQGVYFIHCLVINVSSSLRMRIVYFLRRVARDQSHQTHQKRHYSLRVYMSRKSRASSRSAPAGYSVWILFG